MPATAIECYNNSFESMFTQTRRMSGPYLPQTSNLISSVQRRYSVQTDGSPFLSTPPAMCPPNSVTSQQSFQCMPKPALRNVLSAPIHQLPNPAMPMSRRESLKSQSGESNLSLSELARYKTELCRPFEETGQCRYGAKCQFAHGKQEMRSLNRHPKYKTELCRTYHSTGFCTYGQRCNFIHTEQPHRRMSASASLPCPQNSAFGSAHQLARVMPFDFPLSINSTGDSPASSVDGGSPSLSPAYLNDDVFPHVSSALRLSPTPSYGSDSSSSTSSGSLPSPPGSPQNLDEAELSLGLSHRPLDLGLEMELFGLKL